jgi:hypothetical protein
VAAQSENLLTREEWLIFSARLGLRHLHFFLCYSSIGQYKLAYEHNEMVGTITFIPEDTT